MSDDLADLHRLDRALDELAGSLGGTPTQELDAPTAAMNGTPTVELNGHRPTRPKARQPLEPGEERDGPGAVDALVATAAGLRAAVPPPSPEVGARGRDAFLASTDAFIGSQQRGRRRKLLLRATALAAALLLVGIPGALARQALPGSPLFPVREATQDARVALTPSPVSKARILLDDAERLRAEALRSNSSRDDCIRVGREEVEEALARLRGLTSIAAEQQRVRAQGLLDDFRDLAEGKLPGEDHSGPGGGGDQSGKGRGGDDPGGDRHGSGSGPGGGDDSGASGPGGGDSSGGGGHSGPDGGGSLSGGGKHLGGRDG